MVTKEGMVIHKQQSNMDYNHSRLLFAKKWLILLHENIVFDGVPWNHNELTLGFQAPLTLLSSQGESSNHFFLSILASQFLVEYLEAFYIDLFFPFLTLNIIASLS